MAPGAELRAYGSLIYRRDGDGWRPHRRAAAERPAVDRGRGADRRASARRRADPASREGGRHEPRAAAGPAATDRGRRARPRVAEHPAAARHGRDARRRRDGPAGGEYARFVDARYARDSATSAGDRSRATPKAAWPTRSWWIAARRASAWCRATWRRRPSPVPGCSRRSVRCATCARWRACSRSRCTSSCGADAGIADGRRTRRAGACRSACRAPAPATPRWRCSRRTASRPAPTTTSARRIRATRSQQLAAGTLDAVIRWSLRRGTSSCRRAARARCGCCRSMRRRSSASRPKCTASCRCEIPARTYPGQPEPVPTVAATALLVANSRHARCRRRSGPRDAVRSGLERRPRGHRCAAVARAGAGRHHDSAA